MSNIIISINDNQQMLTVNSVPEKTSYSLIGKGGKSLTTEKKYDELASIFYFEGQKAGFHLVPGSKKYTFKKIGLQRTIV